MNDFYNEFNESLLNMERKMEESILPNYYFQNIFIVGLPRSGTTLLSQILYNCFEIGCTNNFIAKFWKTPLVGFKLFNDNYSFNCKTSYKSILGIGSDAFSPHEFSFFWHDLIQMDSKNIQSYNPSEMVDKIDWKRINRILHQINTLTNVPVVFKPLELIGYFLQDFVGNVSNSKIIYIERNLVEVATSLARVRKIKTGSVENWYSSIPFHKADSNDLNFAQEIKNQIESLTEMYNTKIVNLNNHEVFKLSYSNLVSSPKNFVAEIADFLNLRPCFDSLEELKKSKEPSVEVLTSDEIIQLKKAFHD